jgi:hypothetical protein
MFLLCIASWLHLPPIFRLRLICVPCPSAFCPVSPTTCLIPLSSLLWCPAPYLLPLPPMLTCLLTRTTYHFLVCVATLSFSKFVPHSSSFFRASRLLVMNSFLLSHPFVNDHVSQLILLTSCILPLSDLIRKHAKVCFVEFLRRRVTLKNKHPGNKILQSTAREDRPRCSLKLLQTSCALHSTRASRFP